jgi:riboflavin kinase/FMN adenylyltransferase
MPQSVLTIGNFDGPHRGHLAIIREARRMADSTGAQVKVLTFDPPPLKLLRPDALPPAICSLEHRIAALEAGGADEVIVIEPTRELLGLDAEAFVQQIVDQHHPLAILEGPDFRFGKGRSGDLDRLRKLGQRFGFEAIEVPRVTAELADQQQVPISSSLVRWLIGRGRVADAQRCLGRSFTLTATVVRGEQRGRQLGFPTANLDPIALAGYIIPADGVYACEAYVESAEGPRGRGAESRTATAEASTKLHHSSFIPHPSVFPAAVSIGTKPTFDKKQLTVEAHLIDFDGDLYGRRLILNFAHWLRDQYPFPSREALVSQLHRDVAQAKALLTRPADPAAA